MWAWNPRWGDFCAGLWACNPLVHWLVVDVKNLQKKTRHRIHNAMPCRRLTIEEFDSAGSGLIPCDPDIGCEVCCYCGSGGSWECDKESTCTGLGCRFIPDTSGLSDLCGCDCNIEIEVGDGSQCEDACGSLGLQGQVTGPC